MSRFKTSFRPNHPVPPKLRTLRAPQDVFMTGQRAIAPRLVGQHIVRCSVVISDHVRLASYIIAARWQHVPVHFRPFSLTRP